jgi:hypothetical protein
MFSKAVGIKTLSARGEVASCPMKTIPAMVCTTDRANYNTKKGRKPMGIVKLID